MKKLILLALIPACVFGNMIQIKKSINLRMKQTLIFMDEKKNNGEMYYLLGRNEAYLDILELIQQIEENEEEKEKRLR